MYEVKGVFRGGGGCRVYLSSDWGVFSHKFTPNIGLMDMPQSDIKNSVFFIFISTG